MNLIATIKSGGRIYVAIAACMAVIGFSSSAQTVKNNLPVTNGVVNDIIHDGNTVYVGGGFSYIGPNSGHGALIDSTTGTFNQSFPRVNGAIYASASDSAGGWYIGGSFTKVGSVYRNGLAHINFDGTVAAWDPNVRTFGTDTTGGTVRTIAVKGDKVYFGGYFSSVGDSTRHSAACVSASNGIPYPWNPDVKGGTVTLYTIAVGDTQIFLGGNYQQLGSNNLAGNLAAVDTNLGVANVWHVSLSGGFTVTGRATPPEVYGVLVYDDSTLYAWGNFIGAVGSTRNGLFSIKTNQVVTSSSLSLWYPNQAGTNFRPINAIAIVGDTVYVGGEFLSYGTNTTVRNRLAASKRTGNGRPALAWTASVDPTSTIYDVNNPHTVNTLKVVNGKVYVGGGFSSVGGQTRSNIAAIDRMTGVVDATWNPGASSAVQTITPYSANLYAGGNFTSVNGSLRNNLAAIDATTNTVTAFDPSPDGSVTAMALSGSSLYVGGNFTNIGGAAKTGLAELNKTTGLASSFMFNTAGIFSLSAYNNKLYVGGQFSMIGDSTRNSLGEIDLTAGQVTVWDPNVNGGVYSIIPTDSVIYAAGNFTTMGGQPRVFLAAANAATGAVTSWDPSQNSCDYMIRKITTAGTVLYAGGGFTTIGGASRTGLAAFGLSSGTILPWDANIVLRNSSSDILYDIEILGSTMYIGGAFKSVGGLTRSNVAAIDIPSVTPTSWTLDLSDQNAAPNPNGTNGFVYGIDVNATTNAVYIGGSFTTANNDPASYFVGADDQNNAALPVELTTFTAIVKGSTVELRWNTATEVNNYGFEIERTVHSLQSSVGSQLQNKWKKIGFVNGSGNSSSPKQYSFIDNPGLAGAYNYRLKQIDNDGKFKYSSIVEINAGSIPTRFELAQNYPNPFNPSTTISYSIPTNSFVMLKVLNILGQEVATVVNENMVAGKYTATFNSGNLASGVYLYRIEAGSFHAVKKMLLIR